MGPERTLEMAGKYATAAKEVASKRGLPSLDLWTKLQAVPNWQSLLTDGLHFAPEGNKKVFELLVELISTDLPQLKQGSLLLLHMNDLSKEVLVISIRGAASC